MSPLLRTPTPRSARRCTRAFLAVLLVALAGPALAATSNDGMWTEITKNSPALGPSLVMIDHPAAYRVYQVDGAALGLTLERAPLENPVTVRQVTTVMFLPMPDGTFQRFQVVESPILSSALQAEHPELETYMAQGIDDPTATARLDRTPAGFHAMILSLSGTVLIDPYSRDDTGQYVSFYQRDVAPPAFTCLTQPDLGGTAPIVPFTPSGGNLRTYRLVVTATGEYTSYFGGTAGAQAHITTTVNRVDGIYEREICVRLNLVAFNIYTDKNTDPFPNGATVDGNLLNQNQTATDAAVGASNYDIGHIVSQGGGGGLAQFGVCASNKAKGGTSLDDPQGDGFDVDYVAHEMGHQFHADHTFNGTTGSCGGGNRVASSAYEPGSGTTIMAYAGICGAENIQPHSDPFFHTRSFDQIVAFREGGGTCGPSTATGNSPPNVSAGPDFTIPTNTPFRLTATGSDPDGDPITFCWEQFDLGTPSPPANNADGPLFRCLPPTTGPTRVFPKMSTVLSGVSDPWEHLPTVARDLNFRCTARDNRMGGGGVNYSSMVVHVTGSPFFVTSPNGGEHLTAGCATTVTWTVGGGSVASNVDILFSKDGGNNFTTLVAGTPNDGSETVALPCDAGTTQGRIMVQGSGNIFFDVSNGNFTVTPAAGAPPTVTASATGGPVDASCQRVVPFSGTAHDDCSLNAANVTVSVTLPTANATLGVPTISIVQLDAQNVAFSGSVLVSNLAGPPATVAVTASAKNGCGITGSTSATASVFDNTPPAITCPADLTVQCDSHCDPTLGGVPATDPAIVAWLASATATDNCDPSPVVGPVSPPACFPLGDTPVTFAATDKAGNSSSCTRTVHVIDTTPPVIAVSLDRTVLWPPNHKLVTINAAVTVTDACDPNPFFELMSIVSNEPDNGLGDGDTPNDIQGASYGTADTQFQLRSERAGPGSGRKYTISYRGFDHSGNTADAVAVVKVPHDQSAAALAANGLETDGSFAPGAATFAVVIRSVPRPVVDDGGDLTDSQVGGAADASQPVAATLLFDTRAVDQTLAFVGNTAGILKPVQTARVDADGDGIADLVCVYNVADAQALAAASGLDDGPIGLHYSTRFGDDFLVQSIAALGPPITLPDLGTSTPVGGVHHLPRIDGGGVQTPDVAAAPLATALAGVYPNPVRASARVDYSLAAETRVDLAVYDVRGARVRTLASGSFGPGRYSLTWDGRGEAGSRLGAGMYFVRLSAGRYTRTLKTAIMP